MVDSVSPPSIRDRARLSGYRHKFMLTMALTVSGLLVLAGASLFNLVPRPAVPGLSGWRAVVFNGVLAALGTTLLGWFFWRAHPPRRPPPAEHPPGDTVLATHKAIEQELRRFRMAVEASVDMILLTDAEGFIEYVNPSFTRVAGWTSDEIVGRNIHILSGGGADAASQAIWKILRRGEFWSGRLLSRRRPRAGKGGEAREPGEYWAEASITPIHDGQGAILGYVSIQRDISALVAEEDRLAREREDAGARLKIADILARPEPLRERFGAVLDVLFGLRDLAAQGRGGVFLRRRDADFLDIFLLRGEFSEEFIRREREIPLGACRCGSAAVSCQLLISDDGVCGPRRISGKETPPDHGTDIVPLNGNGAALGVMFLYSELRPTHDPGRLDMLRQVGELMGLSILQAQAAAALQEARDVAFASSRLKSDFLANTSHEIRTPMNGVLGMLELLRSTPLTPEQREFAETAHNSAEALLQVINDILDFSKIEAGKLQLEIIDFDVRRLAEEVCALLARRAHAKGLRFNCFVEPGLPDKLRGDPTRVRQVLTNLVGNAIKFTERGEVAVEVSGLSKDERRAVLRFTVRDSGIGIAPEALALLFQPFIQADRAVTRRYGGTGLGLAIAKDLVERMGGEIGVESAPGQGAVFHFTVALEASPLGQVAAPPPPPPSKPLPPPGADYAGRRVLLVEDDAISRKVAMAMLGRFGLAVTVVTDGLEALAELEKARYELVLMDCQMPNLDGFETARAWRSREAELGLPPIPVIALTANAMPPDREACLAAGMDDHLAKPIVGDLLRLGLARWLAGRGSLRV